MTETRTLADILGGDVMWMFGNLLLAWAGVLFAWQLVGSRVRARRASWLMAGAALVGGGVRTRDTDGAIPIDLMELAGVVAVVVLLLVVTWRVREGDRWALAVVFAGAVAFAPNAPYVLTDGMHYVQDLRSVRLDLADGAILAIVYGWFITLGMTAWVILLDIARARIPVRFHVGALAAASLLAALAIYVGRIERIHSWHLVTRPRETAHAFWTIATHAGPAVFVFVWICVVAATSIVGLWTLDRARRHDPPRRPIRPVAGWSWFTAGALLTGLPFVGLLDPEFGLATARATPGNEVLSIVAGVSLAAYGLRLLDVLAMRRMSQTVVAAIPIIAVGWLLVGASTLGWWAQYRALCEFGPGTDIHREACR